MNPGKQKCEILRNIRMDIAKKYGLPEKIQEKRANERYNFSGRQRKQAMAHYKGNQQAAPPDL